MRNLTMALTLAFPLAAHAAGTESNTPPQPTNTTKSCETGLVWDEGSKSCVAPKDSRLDDGERYRAVREYAYAGQLDAATTILDAMADQSADQVLTYRGFIARKTGDLSAAELFYDAALIQNPDNLLARSYMGQGFVENGDIVAARAQLSEIRQRGGRGTWPEISLRLAIENGRGYAY